MSTITKIINLLEKRCQILPVTSTNLVDISNTDSKPNPGKSEVYSKEVFNVHRNAQNLHI
jgi:hypothetical protein